jgi:hypothetical protein
MEFKSTTKLVKDILVKNKKARDSDIVLYLKVMERLNPPTLTMPFGMVLRNLKELGLPCYDTVSRARRKIQSDNPDLQGSERVQDRRAELEEEYRKYAKS